MEEKILHSPFFVSSMRARFLSCLLLLVLTLGCTTPPSRTPPASVTVPPVVTSATAIPVVSIVAGVSPDTLHPNDTLQIDLNLQTWLFSRTPNSTSRKADPNSPVREMRFCTQFDTPCQPAGAWLAYQPHYLISYPVDWIGERDLLVIGEFRDAVGNKIPAAEEMESRTRSPIYTVPLESIVDTRTPIASQPPFVQTAVAATRIAFPVTGSLEIQNGMCCAGGKVQSTITITAAFSATTPQGSVTEMRTLPRCPTADEMQTAAWEPFVPQKTYPYKITVANFVGWYLSVQYRDSNGNLSPIYCDDISIEGMQ